MKHILLPLMLAFCLLAVPALAEPPVSLGEPLTGTYLYPEGSTETDALYIYRYRYPQIAGESDLAAHINTTYAYTVEDTLGFEVPMLASEMQPGDPQKVVDIDFQLTCLNENFLSVRIIKQVSVAGSVTAVTNGHVFALTGSGAGRIINLPVLLGLLDAEETDEWLMTRQTNKADRIVREMVWEKLQQPSPVVIYDDLTFEEFEAGFYPEEDFYLTESGDPCFFLQAGTVAPEEQGEVLIVLPLDELLDEM